MVTTTVLMTVHDREPEVLLSTLRSLWRCGLEDAEIVIVNDRSRIEYSWVRAYCKARFRETKWISTGSYDGFRLDGYGNPARAFNVGLAVATGERIVLMSSDVLVTTGAVKAMEKFQDGTCLFTPRVVDIESQKEYCGPSRFFPMPWFLSAPTRACQEIGGWDEAYLGGLCFEDNDVIGRLALKVGRLRTDWTSVVFHQSHDQPAYDTNIDGVVEANDRNRALTMEKWKGIPFEWELTPFDVIRAQDPTGCALYTMKDDGLLSRVMEKSRAASV